MTTTQINIRVSEDFLEEARNYAKFHGYLNVQEFIRDAARKKIYEQYQVREEYLQKLKSKDATTFLSDKEADEFDKKLERKTKLE
jgi:metal-responsive CopG/Arc/MetJ family transcriptional regulator